MIQKNLSALRKILVDSVSAARPEYCVDVQPAARFGAIEIEVWNDETQRPDHAVALFVSESADASEVEKQVVALVRAMP